MKAPDNTSLVSEAFSAQSAQFDALYLGNKLTCAMRDQFRAEVLKQAKPKAQMLELNCGTGIDTVFFAKKGFHIWATDNSDGMLQQIKKKVAKQDLQHQVAVQKCDFAELYQLQPRKFDYIYSNFSGLNCSDNLSEILLSLSGLLHPHGKVTLVLMPRICPWETLMALRGDFKTAFRRFRKNGTPAHISGRNFICYYYNPRFVKRTLRKDFRVLNLKGMAITVPPPFVENFVERHPHWYKFLNAIDRRLSRYFPFHTCCDQYMITLEKK